jgi:hypothetical protein
MNTPRTAQQIERELRDAQVKRMQHPPSSRMNRLLSERVKTLRTELALTLGTLSIGAL